MHAETDTKEGNPILARIADCRDLALAAAVAETAGNEDPVGLLQQWVRSFLLDLLGFDAIELNTNLVGDSTMHQSLQQALVGFLEAHVLADDRDPNRIFRVLQNLNHPLPIFQMGCASPDIEFLDDPLIETLFVKNQWHFVEPLDVFGGDDGVFGNVAEMRDLRLYFSVQKTVGATKQDVRLDAQSGQFFYAMLRRLRL